MAVYVAWTGAPVPADLVGPWEELRVLSDDLSLLASEEALSRVYHELKWSLPPDTALFVAPLGDVPKLKGMPPGTLGWLRRRAPRG
ncbi:hypothetical protein H9L10_03950 [Phycicoccus endophyticus]|uniref:Uncharacterized protein n=1 Tax=Phycicoccus endophyticus TaxID=1690220 RepID=A0A7G9R3N2_9MICO|nr:hypothetical protein [Phycicoccus endophyticus]NHI18026.1 hypothetical protein [Phycicoccus endophyticus]QNN50207.1 hypothetical protein H9L10_03950 [Phycicoccus endophyticus]GGL27009.1 hypothetical protein GCM10012283_06560 [Phycicoccus endophyticus]